jgi:hypothetical protein
MNTFAALCLLVGSLFACMGCSGDDGDGSSGGFPSDTTCGLSVAISGGVEGSFTPDTAVACATQLSSTAGIDAAFLQLEGDVRTVELEVADVTKGETGQGFAARVRVTHEDDRRWGADGCVVDITKHSFVSQDDFADRYLVAGSGVCDEPAASIGGTDPEVTIGELSFVATVPWTQ